MRDSQGRLVDLDSGKIRHRDIWDLAWLSTQRSKLDSKQVAAKIGDYGVVRSEFMLAEAIELLPAIVDSNAFKAQMTRFIDSATLSNTLGKTGYPGYLSTSVGKFFSMMQSKLAAALK